VVSHLLACSVSIVDLRVELLELGIGEHAPVRHEDLLWRNLGGLSQHVRHRRDRSHLRRHRLGRVLNRHRVHSPRHRIRLWHVVHHGRARRARHTIGISCCVLVGELVVIHRW